MSNFKPNYFQRRSKPQGPKANERIRAIDVQVNRLRQKIELDPKSPRYLQTVRGRGYILRPD